jgi:hypothetical protein
MNADVHLEHRAGSSQGKHEGEPSLGLCDRLDRTRDNSQRQLPTDHDYAVPTREYQTDQSSLKLLRLLLALSSGKQRQQQKQPHRSCGLTRLLQIRPMHSSSCVDLARSLANTTCLLLIRFSGNAVLPIDSLWRSHKRSIPDSFTYAPSAPCET